MCNKKKQQRQSGSRCPRRGLDAWAGRACLWELAAAAALPQLCPAGPPSLSPLHPPPLSSLFHETAPQDCDIPQTQNNKSHFKLKGKRELPSLPALRQDLTSSCFLRPLSLTWVNRPRTSSPRTLRGQLEGDCWSAELWEL